MTTPQAVLTIDLGTSSVKALVVGHDGAVLGRGVRHYPVNRPKPGFAEQDPNRWWEATCDAVQLAVAQCGGASVEAIGLSGQMHGTVLADQCGRPLRPAIVWEDTRSGSQAAEIEQRVGRRSFIETTGSAAASGFQASSVLWVQKHEPEVWKRTRNVLLPKDYLRFRLSGEFISEPSDASSTVLLRVRERQWSGAILDTLQIDPALMPAIVPSDSVASKLSAGTAAAIGLRSGLPIAGGAGDAPAAALACGGAEPGTLLLTISSGSQAISATGSVIADPEGRLHSWCHCLSPETGSGWYLMAATMASGLAMRWLSENVLDLPEAGRHDRLEQWAAEVDPGADGLLFVPYLAGERTPHMDSHARGMFLGLTTGHDRRHLVRAVMEGTILAVHQAYSVLAKLHGSPTKRFVLAGGGARSAVWTQIVADVFDLPVYPNLEPDGSAMGAAVLAGASIGWFGALEGASAWRNLAEPIAPRSTATATYRQLAEVFNTAYAKHRDDFQALGRQGPQAEAWG